MTASTHMASSPATSQIATLNTATRDVTSLKLQSHRLPPSSELPFSSLSMIDTWLPQHDMAVPPAQDSVKFKSNESWALSWTDSSSLHTTSKEATTTSSPAAPTSASPKCPYDVGTNLSLERYGQSMEAIISKVYQGGDGEVFSNSCTVQIQVLRSDAPASHGTTMVLKIFDWRFMSRPRKQFHCARWSNERSCELLSLSKSDRISFEDWLRIEMSMEDYARCPLAPLHKYGILTHMDLYGYLLLQPMNKVQHFVQQGLIPHAPTIALQEVFLYNLSQMQLAYEDHVSRIVNAHMPDRMPQAYGLYNVCVEDRSTDSTRSNVNIFPIRGLLMDVVPGVPVRFYQPGTEYDRIFWQLTEEIETYMLQLRRYNLQLQDTNVHNILLCEDAGDGLYLSFVDYGAIIIVLPDRNDLDAVRVRFPFTNNPVRLPREHYIELFDYGCEGILAQCLARQLLGPSSSLIQQNPQKLLSRALCPATDTHFDGFIWYSIVFQIIHSCDDATFQRHIRAISSMLRSVCETMRDEADIPAAEPWWSRVTRKVAMIVQSSPEQALRVVTFLGDMLGNDYRGSRFKSSRLFCHHDWSLSLRLVHDMISPCQPDRSGVLFPGIAERLALIPAESAEEHHTESIQDVQRSSAS